MKKITLWLLMIFTCGYAMAQDKAGACREDVRQYCPQANGGKAVMDCLLDHQKDISNNCYDTLKKRMNDQQGLRLQTG